MTERRAAQVLYRIYNDATQQTTRVTVSVYWSIEGVEQAHPRIPQILLQYT